MDSSIKKLPVDVVNKIAAGEVIQRPSSILKELVENSIDSGAKKIDVFITDYGKTEIQVSDDGYGMNLKNLRICFLNHSTSKLNSFDDLFALKSKDLEVRLYQVFVLFQKLKYHLVTTTKVSETLSRLKIMIFQSNLRK